MERHSIAVDWSGVAPDDSRIEPLDAATFALRLRRLSEHAEALTVLRQAMCDRQVHGEPLSRDPHPAHDHRVDFVIVGGVASALHGGTRVTFDLDVVPALSRESWESAVNLLWALAPGLGFPNRSNTFAIRPACVTGVLRRECWR